MRRNNTRPARHGVGGCLLPVAIVILGLLGPGSACLMSQANDPLSDLGVPPFLTTLQVESGWIGMANGNLHLEIPLASYPQRGRPPITIALAYDSTIWPQCSTCFAELTRGWRIKYSMVPLEAINDMQPGNKCTSGTGSMDEWDTYKNFSSTDPQSSTQQFNLTTVQGYLTPCGDFRYKTAPNADGFATDLSGYHMYVTNSTVTVIYGPDGTIELPDMYYGSKSVM